MVDDCCGSPHRRDGGTFYLDRKDSVNFEDCSVNDIERLRPRINQLAIDFANLQAKQTEDLDVRDQSIVLNAALNMIQRSCMIATKKSFSTRFYRAIVQAMSLTRMFALGRMASGK